MLAVQFILSHRLSMRGVQRSAITGRLCLIIFTALCLAILTLVEGMSKGIVFVFHNFLIVTSWCLLCTQVMMSFGFGYDMTYAQPFCHLSSAVSRKQQTTRTIFFIITPVVLLVIGALCVAIMTLAPEGFLRGTQIDEIRFESVIQITIILFPILYFLWIGAMYVFFIINYRETTAVLRSLDLGSRKENLEKRFKLFFILSCIFLFLGSVSVFLCTFFSLFELYDFFIPIGPETQTFRLVLMIELVFYVAAMCFWFTPTEAEPLLLHSSDSIDASMDFNTNDFEEEM
jgi:hypothetical protein